MKLKWFLSVYCLFFFIFGASPVYSEENTPVQPNVYEDNEIDIDTNHFHEEERLKQKSTLTEEQKALTFERKPNDKFKAVENDLFSEQQDANLIASKTERLKLFSKQQAAKSDLSSQPEEEESETHSFWLIGLLLLAAAVLGSYLFFYLIPKIQQAIHSEGIGTRRAGTEKSKKN
ncbi:type VII secretion protein EssA [Bacillus ectoiniformans]|uniref:type VII secretion protein EssA n=1 Tax=Bacillus ectoiniformans TaxID=1494429 RepID=UPI0019563320|nr:type VII secretion protein EssA [Bacillus ectoiniformans]MBM7649220.1 type VII secretion protein EssA [Bacillus ectoiniformans]